jgi:DNA-binding MarR family transcriptional regulator
MTSEARRELMRAAWEALKDATWSMRVRVIKKHRGNGPTPAQMGVLQALLSDEEGMTPSELSGCLRVAPATVTGSLNALEDDGIIERVRTQGDRRVVHIRLTSKGRERLMKWRATFEKELSKHFAPLSDDELRTLASLLQRVGKIQFKATQGPVSARKSNQISPDSNPRPKVFEAHQQVNSV